MKLFVSFSVALLLIVLVSSSYEESTATTTAAASKLDVVQKRFNQMKRRLEKQQAKKSIRQFAFKHAVNQTGVTSEYDPILKKPTSSPVTRKNRLLSLTNKVLNRDLNEQKRDMNSSGFSFRSKIVAAQNNTGNQVALTLF